MKKILSALIALGFLTAPAFALAATTSTAGASTLAARITKAKDRADQEIDRRVAGLGKLSTRIAEMKHISASDQASLQASLADQVQALGTLKTQIDGETATSSLRADIESITKSYRVYALVIPQATLMAAADRALSVSDQMNALATKLSDRITSATTTTASTTASLQATLSDMQAKIADAEVQANAAVTEIAVLKPDDGDQAVQQSNLAMLKDARAKIQAAQKDLVAARADAGTIVKALGSKK